jgi:hypothetical protein
MQKRVTTRTNSYLLHLKQNTEMINESIRKIVAPIYYITLFIVIGYLFFNIAALNLQEILKNTSTQIISFLQQITTILLS